MREGRSPLPVTERYLAFQVGKTHCQEHGATEIRAHLGRLAVEQHVAASRQNVAFSALMSLYLDVQGRCALLLFDLEFPGLALPGLDELVRIRAAAPPDRRQRCSIFHRPFARFQRQG